MPPTQAQAPTARAHLAQRAQLVVAHHLGQAELQVGEQGDQLHTVGRGKLRMESEGEAVGGAVGFGGVSRRAW